MREQILAGILGCPVHEADQRMQLRQTLEVYGHLWAADFEKLASDTEDRACFLDVNNQPQFAFLRGQAQAYRRMAKDLRGMSEANNVIGQRVAEEMEEVSNARY